MSKSLRPRRLVRPLLAVVLVGCAASPHVVADDAWPPYPRDEPVRRRSAPAAPQPPGQPMLRPMDGQVAPPPARVDEARPSGGQYGTPYGPPPGGDGAAAQPGQGWGQGSTQGWSTGTSMGGPASRDAMPPPRDAGRGAPPVAENVRGVERGELTPVMAGDGSGLPLELWRGLDVKTVETLIARIEIPPRSPAIHDLWRRLITSNATPPAGQQLNAGFDGIRAEVLFRSGMLKEAAAVLANAKRDGSEPLSTILAARGDIALGLREQGCAAAKAASGAKDAVPKPVRAEEIEMLGYCAAAAGNPSAAGLAADLARDEGVSSPGLALLDAVAGGGKPQLQHLKSISVVDYRLLELAKASQSPEIVERAQPALLALLATDESTPSGMRLVAAEAAARLNAISSEQLAGAYRAVGQAGGGEASGAGGKGADAAHQRAALFKAIEAERTPLRKVRLIRSFLDAARHNEFYLPALEIVARPAASLQMVPEIGWFAETGIETALVAGDFARARAWAAFGSGLDRPGGPAAGGGTLTHWLALADIADPALPKSERGRELPAVEQLALRGRFNADQLNRIATVLDALDYNVPVKLWEAASRSPQPTTGHLPATGVLSELQDASKKKEFGRTVLLAMDTLGPHGAEGAHIIALGDSIRALRRAGLDKDARRLGLEALFAAWPRQASN